MSDSLAQPVYGVVGQPLTQEYLAGQLPIFQPRVPRSQPTPQFATNAPANLPLPPLYPGELIKLQEHRVVCTDVFEEPAVGAVYVSNYRVIFHGNLISDPESLDVLHESSLKPQPKKENAEATSSPIPYAKHLSSKLNLFSSVKPEPSFKSFLTGSNHDSHPSDGASEGDSQLLTQQYGTLPRSQTHRFKSGLKKISSLRLTSHTRPKFKHSATSQLLSIGLSHPDGSPGAESSQETIKEVTEDKEAGFSATGHYLRTKRKDILYNYHQDTVSLDSVSVSSTSEFSTGGTDEGSSGPVDILGAERRCCVDKGLGVSDPLAYSNGTGGGLDSAFEVSGTSCLTVDSGITVDRSLGKGSPAIAGIEGKETGKGSSFELGTTSTGKKSLQTTVTGNGSPSLKTAIDGRQVLQAASELEDTSSHKPNAKADGTDMLRRVGKEGLASSVPTTNGKPSRSHFDEYSDGSKTDDCLIRGMDRAGREYANIRILADWSAGLKGVGHSVKGVSRKRSKSNSSSIRKKPKPLPRKALTRQVLTTGGEGSDGSRGFLSSLPANFKPVPTPRSSNTPPTPKRRVVKSTGSKQENPGSLEGRNRPQRVSVASDITIRSSSSSPNHESSAQTTPRRKPPSPPRNLSPVNGSPSVSVLEEAALEHTRGISKDVSPVSQNARTTIKDLSSSPSHRTLPVRTRSDCLPSPATSPHHAAISPRHTSSGSPRHISPARRQTTLASRTTQRRKPPKPPQLSSAHVTPRRAPPSPPKHHSSAPSTPLSRTPGCTHQHAVSDCSTGSSTPSSPFYASSTFSSDMECTIGGSSTNGDQVGATSDPVPPPRRRRRSSKYSSQESSKSSIDVLPVSPEELLADQERLPQSAGVAVGNEGRQQEQGPTGTIELSSLSKKGLHERSCDPEDRLRNRLSPEAVKVELPGSSAEAHDHEKLSHNSDPYAHAQNGELHDPDGDITRKEYAANSCIIRVKAPNSPQDQQEPSEEDLLNSPLMEESSDVFKENITPLSSTSTYTERFSIASSARTSRTSLTVFADSTVNLSGVTLRPLSVTDDAINHQLEFSGSYENPGESFVGGHTLPKNSLSTLTWGGRGKGPSSRQSGKGGLMPASTRYSLCVSFPLRSIHSVRKVASLSLKEHGVKLPEGLLILCRTFQSMRLHIHQHNTYDADGLKEILERKFLVDQPLHLRFAFEYRAAIRHPNPTFLQNRSPPNHFHLSNELLRLGLQDCKQWTVSRVLTNHPDVCPSYPSHLLVPTCTGDLDYIRGAKQYREGRFPTMTWYNRSTGAGLFRAAGTLDGRGNSNMQEDEALLQSISGSKLDPKGPPMIVHVYTDKPESGLNERSAEQGRTFYYHNCKFIYGTSLPDSRAVRHSFNKLQAMLENALSDEDYLIALDTTRWLQRVADLLSNAHTISCSVMTEGAHALVCYEAGWDRTTQLVSLAQLLMDPYYRTMDGFQVLVQKEWVWFGHPFKLRHSRSGKSKEDSPVFLQWVDCVWQLTQQCPSAFEFNERMLVSMVEHSYSGLFGTFMTNNERARKQYFTEKLYDHMSVSTHTVSFWTWVGMINASGRTFYNDLYDPRIYPGTLKPNSSISCLKLWTSHYCRCKPQENVYQASILQTQLEELMKTYKRLETLYAELAPTSTKEDHTPAAMGLPPPLGPRDELLLSSGGDSVHRDRPVPPPKPPAKAYMYENLKEFLIKEGFDPSICMHLELGPAICQGSLYKLGARRKNWLQRWFVLDFSCQYFAYFENQTAYSNKDTPKGVIRLSDIIRVFQEVKRKDHLMKNIFMLETPHRTYQMQAPSITSMYIWMACLELPVSALKLGVHAVSSS